MRIETITQNVVWQVELLDGVWFKTSLKQAQVDHTLTTLLLVYDDDMIVTGSRNVA